MSIVEREIAKTATRRRRKKGILTALIIILVLIIAAVLYVLLSKKPVISIIPGRIAAPTYVRSLYGDFDWPIGVAVSRSGDRIYVVDSNNRKVKMYDKNGKAVGSFGTELKAGSDEPGFANPLYAAVNSRGDVYVSDRSAAAILAYDRNGKFLRRFSPKEKTGFTWSPLAVAFDQKDNLYVTDAKQGEHRVLVFDKDGVLKLSFGKEGSGNGEFSFANGLAIDKKGQIFVADSNNARVQVFDSKGKYMFTIGKTKGKSALSHPLGVAISENDRVHVSDTFGHNVQVYNTSGKFLYNFGTFGIGEGEFQFPSGIAVSGSSVYVVDRENKRVQVWEY